MSAAGGARAAREAAAPVLALYRRILRLHAAKLPPPMAAVAGPFVRDEFRQHLASGKTTREQWRSFMGEWTRYCEMLGGEADLGAPAPAAPGAGGGGASRQGATAGEPLVGAIAASSGPSLEQELLGHLSEEQAARLQSIKAEALRYGRQLLTPEPPGGAAPSEPERGG